MTLYETLQNLMDQVPALVQPLIVALAGMIPYVEGEGSAVLGVVAGVNPVVAAVAGAAGNILIVTVIVHFGDRIRSAITSRRRSAAAQRSGAEAPEERVEVLAGAAAGPGSSSAGSGATGLMSRSAEAGIDPAATSTDAAPARGSKGRARLLRWVVRFGVPGASLIGPLALPTHLTAATLVATGVRRNWVLLWQVVAIVLWTTVLTLAATGVLSVLVG